MKLRQKSRVKGQSARKGDMLALRRVSPSMAAVVLMVALLGVSLASGQYYYFGKSKIQTREYNFQSFETKHFKILFYPGGESMTEFAAHAAEEYYEAFARELGFGLDYKVPLILYLSPGQFSETNVITNVIEEGVGGFAELFKNRIVVPFNGSYSDLRHVIGHELTHIFEFQMFYRSRLSALLGAVGEFQIPLWVMEGFAEFQSGWVSVGSEVFMRDLVLNNRLVPLQDLHDGLGYLVYREGESFFRYVAEKYGRKKVYEFLHTLKNKRSIDATFTVVFGMSIERFSSDWEKWLRMRYWPLVTRLSCFDTLARRLTDHRKDGSVYNTAPAVSPSGTKIVMISDRLEYSDCYVISALDGRVLKRLVKGGRSGGFETMHLARPGVAWSPDEKLIALVTTSASQENIALIEYPSGRVKKRVGKGLDAIYSPRFSPDGKRIAFVGLKNGFSDIYVVDIGGGEPERITYDMYEERDPVFSPGGDTVVFVSDRPDPGEEWIPGSYSLWMRSSPGQLTRITQKHGGLGYPVFSHSGDYLFYTAEDSASNIHVYSFEEGRVVRRTEFIGEAAYLTLSKDDRKLVFSYFEDVGWDIAVILDPLERIPVDSGLVYRAPADTAKFTRRGLDFERVKPVGFSLSPDYAVGAASYSNYGGLSGVVNIALSDMLGDHRFGIYTDIYGDILNSDLILEYWLLPFRTDYGITLFQFGETPYYNYLDSIVERINRGGQVVGVYPFNRFLRAELGLTAYASEISYWKKDQAGWYVVNRNLEGISYASGAAVFDNTFWTWQGPARGTRTRIGGNVSLFSTRRFQDVYLDFRNYQRLGRRFVFATRLFGVSSFGRDADRYYIGGEDVRGYYWGEFYEDTGPGVGLINFEFRYPFIDRLKLAFPLPLEIGGIRGVAFMDGGLVFRDNMRIWDGANSRLQDLKLGVGAGIRIQISFFFLKLDFAKPLSATDHKDWKFLFGLGTDY